MADVLRIDAGTGPVAFGSTVWTVVAQAQEAPPAVSRKCLGLLIERYWRPIYSFIRQYGNSHEDAKDLTQGFFAEFLEKDIVSYADRSRGKFRTFLMASVKRFMITKHRSLSRRPLLATLSEMDLAAREPSFVSSASEDAERAFMRNWAKCLIENCLARLHEEYRVFGIQVRFRAFEAHYCVELRRSYTEIASELGVTERQVGKHLERARRRFAGLLREELLNSMPVGCDTDSEIDDLLQLLAG